MEANEISEHLYRVFAFVRDSKTWVTSKEIAVGAKVAPRTARAHALRLVNTGLFDLAETFPSHRYRLSPKAGKRNKTFLQRLEESGKFWPV